MADDERTEQEHVNPEQSPADDVEGHGTRNVVAGGLAAAALIGGGAAYLATSGDDSDTRTPAALEAREEITAELDPKAADRDGDGYLTSAELAHEGFKWSVDELKAEVSAPGLALAGFKHSPELIGAEGFAIKGESVLLKQGVDESLDKLIESGVAQEWTDKVRGLDREGDGYSAPEELEKAGYKYDPSLLEEAGFKFDEAELAKAGYKLPLHALGEGGFMIKGESILLKHGVDEALDGLLRKD